MKEWIVDETTLVILKIIGVVIYSLLEYFLGKTSSGSVLGMIIQGALKILNSLNIVKNKENANKEENKK